MLSLLAIKAPDVTWPVLMVDAVGKTVAGTVVAHAGVGDVELEQPGAVDELEDDRLVVGRRVDDTVAVLASSANS